MNRHLRGLLALLAVFALFTAACGDDDDGGGGDSGGGGGGAEQQDLTLGGPQDCETNPFCIPGLERVYDVDLSDDFTPLDIGLVPEALENGEIDIALLFSTSGVIADKGWVVLEDDMGLINADNIVPVLSDELVEAYGDAMAEIVNEVSAALSTEELTELNRRFDIAKEDADAIAADWLTSEGLLS